MEVKSTKLFDRKQCRSCGNRIIVKRVCLDCNEPSVTWCENCLTLEEYIHAAHSELELQ